MRSYYIGIDNGGTLTKAVLFDHKGHEIAQASESIELNTPKPGFTERDMNELYSVNCRCIRLVLKKSGIDSQYVKGVACTGHGKGLYLWGKNDQPAYSGIVSTDTRARKYPIIWKEDGTADYVFQHTFQSILASQQVSLLCWMKDNEPNVYDNIKWVFSVKDYIRFRLTGKAFSELTDASGTNLVDLRTRQYNDELLSNFGLDEVRDCLPPLCNALDQCGCITAQSAQLTGLNEGVPVAGGMFDIDACAIAMDITDEKNLCVIAGTWSINEYISREPIVDGSVLMNSVFCLPEYYLIEESSPTSAGNLTWFAKMFLRELEPIAKEQNTSVYRLVDKLAENVASDEQNLIFLPYIYGANYDPHGKASLIGLDSSHTKAQIIRAVMEGIVFGHMDHIDRLLANRTPPDAIRLGGGAAKSGLWVRLFADITGFPVEIVETKELGALGCAMCAAVSTGFYSNFKQAAHEMVHIKQRIEPNESEGEIYRKKRILYQKTAAALADIWKEF